MDFAGILTSYGFSRVRRIGDELNAECIFCGQRKFWFNIPKRIGLCFRGCFAGSIDSLIVELEGCTLKEAAARLDVGIDWATDIRNRLRKKVEVNPRRHPLSLPALDPLPLEAVRYFAGRDVEPWTLERFGVGVARDVVELGATFWDCSCEEAAAVFDAWPKRLEDFRTRAVFPVTVDDRLAMLEARATNRHAAAKALYPRSMEPRDTLLGLERVGAVDWVVVVEGALDVLSVFGWGFPVVGAWGAGLSAIQAAACHRFRRVYFAFDSDGAGREGLGRAVDALADGVEIFVLEFPAGLDPNAVGKDGFVRAFVNARRLPVGFRFPKSKRRRGGRSRV